MFFLIAFGIFVTVVGVNWWFGLWNNILTLINFFLAALIASSFYETLARALQDSVPTYAFLLDFACLWVLFFLSFGFLRALTGVMSSIQLKFNFWVDIIGRTIASVWLAIAVIFFTFFSIHLAPIPPSQDDMDNRFEFDDKGPTYLGIGPGRMWMAFIQSRSRGALSAPLDEPFVGDYEDLLHPDDRDMNCRVFDSLSRMPHKRRDVRIELSKLETLRNPEYTR